MMNEVLRFYAQRNHATRSIDVYLYLGNQYAQKVMFSSADPVVGSKPLFKLEDTEAQLLMDQLWDSGIRPTEGSGSAGALAATQRHLEDMRELAFSQIKQAEKPTAGRASGGRT